MQIDWWTLALQGINFLVLVWLLKRFLYHPVSEIIEQRKALAARTVSEAKHREAEAAEALKRYENDRAELEQEREQMRVDMHQALEEERAKVKAEAEDITGQMLAKAREDLKKERAALAGDIRAAAVELATDMAADILSSVDPALMLALALRHIETSLKDLTTEARKRIEGHLKGGEPLNVVTAKALNATEKKRWQKMLETHLALDVPPIFSTDESLLGGAELRFPHITLGFTVTDQMTDMKRELLGDDHAQD